MEVFVDDKRIDQPATTTGTVQDAVRHIQTHLCPPGHLVVTLRCDGAEVAGEGMTTTLERAAASLQRLEVFTSTRAALVEDAMVRASASLEEASARCQEVADLLTRGKAAEGIDALGECMRMLQQIHQAVEQSIEMLGLDVEDATLNGAPLQEIMNQPKEVLVQIKQALVAQDHVMLADVLQYEFVEVTQAWHALIARLRQAADELKE